MAKDYYRELCELLAQNGWTRLRHGKGSHEIWCDANNHHRITLCHTKSRHTANEILKRASIGYRF